MSDILEESSILAEAEESTHLSDFGEESFREPLRRLLASILEEAGLSAEGLLAQRQRIVGLLANRLRTEDFYRRFPEIEEEEIVAPIVIIGLSRTGSTMLHRALTSDERFYAPYLWECRNPAPFPETRLGEHEPRIAATEREIDTILERAPRLASIHPWDARGAEEEVILMEPSFSTTIPESMLNVSSYRSWLEAQDQEPAYRYLVRLLKFLQWQKRRAGQERQRWILKAPHHLHQIAELFRAFPDATAINTHRDPLFTVPSLVSFYSALYEVSGSEVDRKYLGRWMTEKWAASLTRTMDYFDEHPGHSIWNVQYRDTAEDPVGTIKRLYEWMNMPMTAEVEAGLHKHLEENARGKREKHSYRAEDYGLTGEFICANFARYRERLHRSEMAEQGRAP